MTPEDAVDQSCHLALQGQCLLSRIRGGREQRMFGGSGSRLASRTELSHGVNGRKDHTRLNTLARASRMSLSIHLVERTNGHDSRSHP